MAKCRTGLKHYGITSSFFCLPLLLRLLSAHLCHQQDREDEVQGLRRMRRIKEMQSKQHKTRHLSSFFSDKWRFSFVSVTAFARLRWKQEAFIFVCHFKMNQKKSLEYDVNCCLSLLFCILLWCTREQMKNWTDKRKKRCPLGEDVGDRWRERMDAGIPVPGWRPLWLMENTQWVQQAASLFVPDFNQARLGKGTSIQLRTWQKLTWKLNLE